jgi:hypothetical protein
MSAKTKSERLRRLVSDGYFAPELPPCFVSEDLAWCRRSILAAIDALPPTPPGKPNQHAFVSEPAWFYFPRFGKRIAGLVCRIPSPTCCCREPWPTTMSTCGVKPTRPRSRFRRRSSTGQDHEPKCAPALTLGTTSASISRPAVRSMS